MRLSRAYADIASASSVSAGDSGGQAALQRDWRSRPEIPRARTCEAAGLTDTRFHDVRHTSVSFLLHLGVAPDMVREIVGYSDIEVTMTIYAHTALDERRQALARLGDALT
jgi:integrase